LSGDEGRVMPPPFTTMLAVRGAPVVFALAALAVVLGELPVPALGLTESHADTEAGSDRRLLDKLFEWD